MKGIFISLEGIEGTGKTTQARLLADYLGGKGFTVTRTAEPGGTPISLKIREILLSPESAEMAPVTELLLYNASRVQHVKEIIFPALERGEVVITDRFSDSTAAYQGYGRGIALELIDSLDLIATDRMRPEITLLLDIDVETGLRRNRSINKRDRLELEDVSFHERVRKGFIGLAAKEKDRIRVIDGSGDVETVHRSIVAVLEDFLSKRGT
jgi:dTMP kinase